MAAPDIILERPFVLVTLSSSSIGIDISQAFGWEFCTVQKVYQTCDGVSVGGVGVFQPDKGIKLVYGSTIYFMVEDKNITFTEVTPP